MAKRNKETRNNTGLGAILTADLIGEVVGNLLGQLVADGSEHLFGKARKSHERKQDRREDLAVRILTAIDERETVRLPRLCRVLKTPLLSVLDAIARLRESGLVAAEDGHTLRLTGMGSETLSAVRRDARHAARELQES